MNTLVKLFVGLCLFVMPFTVWAGAITLDVSSVTASDTGYTLSNNVITLTDPTSVYTLTGSSTTKRIVLPESTAAYNITFNNLSITSSSGSPFSVAAGATCKLMLTGDSESTLKSTVGGYYNSGYAGLAVPEGATLEITELSTGKLSVQGGRYGAGIGGGDRGSGGTVMIMGGTVTAQGGSYGAGIGGGDRGSGGTITLSGGTVTAQGGFCGAGIGGGNDGSGGTITLSGGTVTALGGNKGAGIGSGDNGMNGTIIITGGRLNASSCSSTPKNAAGESLYCVTLSGLEANVQVTDLTIDGLPYIYGAKDLFVDANGKLYLWLPTTELGYSILAQQDEVKKVYTVAITESGVVTIVVPFQTAVGVLLNGEDVGLVSDFSKGWRYNAASTILILTGAETEADVPTFTLSGENIVSDVHVVLASGYANVVLNGLTLSSTTASPFSIKKGATCRLTIAGDSENTLESTASNYAGLAIAEGATLEIMESSTGKLSVHGARYAAGIGGANGTVMIAGGTVTAQGGEKGAGISGSGGTVAISGGTVTAQGGQYGAGIGGGYQGAGGTIMISGGTVTAQGDQSGAAGIGGGYHGEGGQITISGGTLSATGGYYAAGIGKGSGGTSGTITITGGSVNASCESTPKNKKYQSLYRVILTDLEPNTQVTDLMIDGVSYTYGATDLFADANGKLYLWLPTTELGYSILAQQDEVKKVYTVAITESGVVTIVVPFQTAVGVLLNGEDVGLVSDFSKGWRYNAASTRLILTGSAIEAEAPTFTLSGENIESKAHVVLASGYANVVLDGLELTSTKASPFSVARGATCKLTLADDSENTLKNTSDNSNTSYAGLAVPKGATLEIMESNTGTLMVQGSRNGAGIGGGKSSSGGTITILGGSVSARGGYYAAGIGGSNGTVTIAGGTVTAQGGQYATGIGGFNGTVAISGGTLVAHGGDRGAGISGSGGTVSISGGTITAQGGYHAAGIGGGSNGAGGVVSISGGTVVAQGGSNASGIGCGQGYYGSDGTVTITGGSVKASSCSSTPKNTAGQQLYCVTLPGFTTNTQVTDLTIDDRNDTYGATDLFADAEGKLYLWLPTTEQGVNYVVSIKTVDKTFLFMASITSAGKVTLSNTGIFLTCNGINQDLVFWNTPSMAVYDIAKVLLTLTGTETEADAPTFTLSGENIVSDVHVVVTSGYANVVLNGLILTSTTVSPFSLASSATCKLTLVGDSENILKSIAYGYAGLVVPKGTTLEITESSTGKLSVQGGQYAAGIGGGLKGAGGTIMISGGSVTAQGGENAAGIGGASQGAGGAITISGGTVMAQGGEKGAGIGGGREGAGGTITLSGGTVTTQGGYQGAGIGGGCDGAGGTVTLLGGTVTAQGGSGAAGIGGRAGGVVTISGGTVTAQGGLYGAGIGGGYYGAGGMVTISGGTVTVQGGRYAKAGIGAGCNGSTGIVTITGGSVKSSCSPIPKNKDGQLLYCATLTGLTANAQVTDLTIDGFNVTYGTTDLFADAEGKLYLWLPTNEQGYIILTQQSKITKAYAVAITESGNVTIAVPFQTAVGVLLNGEDIGLVSDFSNGWHYNAASTLLTLTGIATEAEAPTFTLSGKNIANKVHVVVTNGYANVVLDGLTLTSTKASPFSIISGAMCKLTLVGDSENTLKNMSNNSNTGYAGLAVPKGTTLEITESSTGKLSVQGGRYAAGIGGGKNGSGGTITLSGGIVTAIGGENAAGIGGGYQGAGGTITLSGGTVTATGGSNAAGIGRGYQGLDGTVTISGGSAKVSSCSPTPTNDAEESLYCVTLPGFEPHAQVTDLTIDGLLYTYGTTDLFADAEGKLYLWLPTTAQGINYVVSVKTADETSLFKVSITSAGKVTLFNTGIFLTCNGIKQDLVFWDTPSMAVYNITKVLLTLTGSETEADAPTFTLSGENIVSDVHLVVASGYANVVLNGLTLTSTKDSPFSVASGATCKLTLAGDSENRLESTASKFVGLAVPEGATLEITESSMGKLTVQGGQYGAGVGGGYFQAGGTILIAGGNLSATGGYRAAGIGGGGREDADVGGVAGGIIMITGGSVTAQGGRYAPGIGSGDQGVGGTVKVTGGSVTAIGGEAAAGIGGGGLAPGCMVTISGGSVIAQGGSTGAGIGGGDQGAGGTLTLSGGIVMATGGKNAAGIGGGYKGAGGTLTLSGGTVTAQGGYDGAGVGGGDSGAGGRVTILGGTVTATGGSYGAGIGGGYQGAGGTVMISDGTVTAQGGTGAIGIGKGYSGTSGTIMITGGSVKASCSSTPKNAAGQLLYCATLTGLTANAQVTNLSITGLNATYGMTDLFSDANGKIYLWLPLPETTGTLYTVVARTVVGRYAYAVSVADTVTVTVVTAVVPEKLVVTAFTQTASSVTLCVETGLSVEALESLIQQQGITVQWGTSPTALSETVPISSSKVQADGTVLLTIEKGTSARAFYQLRSE